jgi:hypothetical protein
MREGRSVEALAQGAHLLCHGPEDELVEGDPLLRRPGFGVLFELQRKIPRVYRAIEVILTSRTYALFSPSHSM